MEVHHHHHHHPEELFLTDDELELFDDSEVLRELDITLSDSGDELLTAQSLSSSQIKSLNADADQPLTSQISGDLENIRENLEVLQKGVELQEDDDLKTAELGPTFEEFDDYLAVHLDVG